MTRYTISLFIGLFMLLICCLSSCYHTASGEQAKNITDKRNDYVNEEIPIQRGMELFNQYCASCHDFSENGIGPNLSGVTYEVDKEWLKAFIHNPPEIIENGDARAVQLFEKYKQYMPPFPMIKGDDLENILGFIHKFSEGEKRNKTNRSGGLINPIVEKIASSNLALVLEAQFTVPPSSDIPPLTRINKMDRVAGNRLFLHDLRGKLYEITKDSNLTVYLDLATVLSNFIDNPGKGSGFGSWAFHPDFAKNGLFYTTHNERPRTAKADFTVADSINVLIQSVLVEWKTESPEASIFSGTHRELLRVDMVTSAHGFQEVCFNPLAKPNTTEYGLLYLGIGDGGAALRGLPFLCDNNEQIWGSVIRINPMGQNSVNGKYGIPEDNPFVHIPNAVGEIWARGFRNPHRITWDETGSGKMFISNIGQHSLEEVNLGIAGADYGWPNREGTFLFDTDANPELVYPLPADDEGYTYPVAQYDHDEGTAISGGFVYAGTKIAQLKGKYIFGDISRGSLFYAEVAEMVDGRQATIYKLDIILNGQLTNMESLTKSLRSELRLGIDNAGELYIFSKSNGTVYKVVDCKDRLI